MRANGSRPAAGLMTALLAAVMLTIPHAATPAESDGVMVRIPLHHLHPAVAIILLAVRAEEADGCLMPDGIESLQVDPAGGALLAHASLEGAQELKSILALLDTALGHVEVELQVYVLQPGTAVSGLPVNAGSGGILVGRFSDEGPHQRLADWLKKHQTDRLATHSIRVGNTKPSSAGQTWSDQGMPRHYEVGVTPQIGEDRSVTLSLTLKDQDGRVAPAPSFLARNKGDWLVWLVRAPTAKHGGMLLVVRAFVVEGLGVQQRP